VAGTETTTHALTMATYHLIKDPVVYEKLTTEIRTTFDSEEDIILESSDKLPYLNAVIDEALRISAPVPIGGYRTSPGAMVDGNYIPMGVSHSPTFPRYFLSYSILTYGVL
jgi:cytochrome P450